MPAALHDCSASSLKGISFETARTVAVDLATPTDRWENVSLALASGRTLAATIVAPQNLPPFDQAAMDGYAVRAAAAGLPRLLPVLGRTRAGDRAAELVSGAAHRVLTGAPLPSGADAVVMQEHVTGDGDRIRLVCDVETGTHIRRCGEDVTRGAAVLEAGRSLSWPEIALLAALGVETVPVRSAVRIALVATGSELCRPGESLTPGAIYDSNSPMLAGLLAGPETRVTTTMVADDAGAIAESLCDLAAEADIVATTAGISVGDEDHVREAVTCAGGRLDVVQVAMKPGKPLVLGRLREACLVGLPGNPQAAAFGALAFIRPMVSALLGKAPAQRLTAELTFSHPRRPSRTELLPVRLAADESGLKAYRCGPEGSHRLMPMVSADAVIILPGAALPAPVGGPFEVLPFDRQRFAE